MVGSHLGKVVGHGDMAWEFESPTPSNEITIRGEECPSGKGPGLNPEAVGRLAREFESFLLF